MRAFVLSILMFLVAAAAHGQPVPKLGVVLMHGKGGSPASRLPPLASALEANGFLVSNLEMPWSGNRSYDADVAAAERQVREALDALKAQGAEKLFVAGHSQGGVFALHLASRVPVDGIAAIAPGGNVGNPIFREKLGESVAQARKYIAEGKGEEKQRFMDFEGSRGVYPVVAPPAAYLSWFDPEGAMNQMRASKAVPPQTPVLFIVPTRDYPALQRVKQMMFGFLPANPLTRLYEPEADHAQAPAVARDEIVRWMREVAISAKR
jgi:pimeloyl-ACP methyl ester carboxylesterase